MRFGIDGRYVQDHFPGIGRYTYNLALNLAALSPEDVFVVFHDPNVANTRYDMNALAVLPNVELVPAPASVFSAKQQFLIPHLARRHRIDLYHSPCYIMPYVMPCPTLATIHDLIPCVYPQSLSTPGLRWLFALLTRLTEWRTTCILVDAESTRHDLMRIMHADPERIVAIPLATDRAFRPYPKADIAGTRQRLGLQTPYVLYLGSNKPHKNLVQLVCAWAKMPASIRTQATLVIAGQEDPRFPETRETVQRLGLGSEIRCLGAVSSKDVPLLYAGAHCLAFPSLYEGFGLPVLEAMACGTPVACSNRSSLPEIVGDSALTFDPEDSDTIRDALVRLLTDPDLHRRLSRAGLQRAKDYTWQRTASETLGVYRQAVTSS